jgi:membrane protease YdiL (CAAX protease family)
MTPDANPPATPLLGSPPPPKPFRAGTAFLALGVTLLVQALVGFSALVGFMILHPKVQDPMAHPDGLAAFLFGGQAGFTMAAVIAGRQWARSLWDDRTPSGLGLFIPKTSAVVAAIAVGGGLAGAFLAYEHYSRGVRLAWMPHTTSGLLELVNGIVIVFLAPPSEEFMFRGLLLKGVEASWGRGWACVVVTVLFVALHAIQIRLNWHAGIFILLFSIAALVARLQTGSLVPPMAMHATYNLVIFAATLG